MDSLDMSREPLSRAKPSANLGAQAWKGVGAEGRGAASLGTLLARKNRTSYDLPPSQEGSSRAEDSKRVNFIAWVNRQWKFVRVHSGITDESQIARSQKIIKYIHKLSPGASQSWERDPSSSGEAAVGDAKGREAEGGRGEAVDWRSLMKFGSWIFHVLQSTDSIVLHGSVIYKSISTILTYFDSLLSLCVCVLSTHEG